MRLKVLHKFFLLSLAFCLFYGGGLFSWDITWEDGDNISTNVYDDGTNALTISGEVALGADITITSTMSGGASDPFPISITGDTYIFSDRGDTRQLIFYAEQGSQILVDVAKDLIFTGTNWGDKHAFNQGLILTFSGRGQTVFNITNDKKVGFEGYFGDGNGNYWDDYDSTGSGVSVYITMDHSYDQAIVGGVNKLVFERTYDETFTNSTTEVSIGKNSFITFVSDVASGLETNASERGFGAIAFDTSCNGAGRMMLHLKGSYTVDSSGVVWGIPYGYNDGALVVSGHYVTTLTTAAAIRSAVDYLHIPAGVEAIFRVIDERAYADSTYQSNLSSAASGGTEPTLSSSPTRRGLLVLNENKSLASLAADPYRNNEFYNKYIYSTLGRGSTPIQPGFIIGVNGCMEVFHNTFLDYVAASTMMLFDRSIYTRSSEDNRTAASATSLKKRNPSALLIDGLTLYDVENFDPTLDYQYYTNVGSCLYSSYFANNYYYGGRHAHIALRGDARMYLRSGVGSDGYISGKSGYTFGTDNVYSFTINYGGDGAFDGSSITDLTYVTGNEGNNVLDVEGKLAIRATADNNTVNMDGFVCNKSHVDTTPDVSMTFTRHPVTSADTRGLINVPPVKIDYMGREISDDSGTLVERPLTNESVYPCYNSSSIFLNDELALHDVRWEHNDVLKSAYPSQLLAEPAVVGGEKAAFHDYFWNLYYDNDLSYTSNQLYTENPAESINTKVPLLSLFDSTLYCHESLVVSGIRFVVTDKMAHTLNDSDRQATIAGNTSTFMCYNHGDSLDMLKRGYGRTILLGTKMNLVSDGTSLSDNASSTIAARKEFTEYAYLNIYRGWNTDGSSSDIKLALNTAVQPRYVSQYGSDVQLTLANLLGTQQKASHLLYLGNGSFTSLGWTSTWGDQVVERQIVTDQTYSYSYGINEGCRPRPWDGAWTHDSSRLGQSSTLADYVYSLSSEANTAAEMYVQGDHYYFGGKNASDNYATEPVVAANEACVFYVNHGGKVGVAADKDCFIDTVFAYRPWPRIYDSAKGYYIDGLSGLVDLPHDQVKFGRSIQPYSIDFPTMMTSSDGQTKQHYLRLSTYNDIGSSPYPATRANASGEEITIPWNMRTDKTTGTHKFNPVKSFFFDPDSEIFRSTPMASTFTLTVPDAVMTVSTGDIITQMRVSGATAADPFHLYVTGGTTGYGMVREFTSLTSDYFNPGEGCHATIFLDGGGRIGLGARDWNEHSKKAWTVLGYDYVTVCPNGNGVIYVNNDLIIADRLPFIPTVNFGSYANQGDTQSLTFSSEDQRLTIYAGKEREIRVPEGGELDLSAFGYVTNNPCSSFPQQIEFAGKVKLVFEAGSKLRFPDANEAGVTHQPVLYFNDESQLIFEGNEDRDEAVWSDYTYSDRVRTKILGTGQIWLNKSAKLKIDGTALVGVETDDNTVTTSLVISIQRQAAMMIGNEDVAGGAFQVGNPSNRSGTIEFTLTVDGAKATFHLDREGFFGLGVGTVNKYSEPDEHWRLKGLYDVAKIKINHQEGFFDVNQIYATSNRRSSIMAIGPVSSVYELEFGSDIESAIIRGGGNILYMYDQSMYPSSGGTDGSGKPPHSTTFAASTPIKLLSTPTADDTGKYNLFASTPVIVQRGLTPFSGSQASFYDLISTVSLSEQTPGKYVSLGKTEFDFRVGYVNGNVITRTTNIPVAGGKDIERSFNKGILIPSVLDSVTNDPVLYAIVG